MKSIKGIGLKEVQAVYGGPEGQLWELIMGQQIHFGGYASSMELAEKAGIGPGMRGVDLCCCNGAGMRFLVRFKNVDGMRGVDATKKVVEQGRRLCKEEGLSNRIEFILADVCDSGLEDSSADFVWGEDAWCYVADKEQLITEAVRIAKPGGVIAFTDWVEGKTGLADDEAKRFLTFMKFPNVLGFEDYQRMLSAHGCRIERAEDTGRFATCTELYMNMLGRQLTYDALKIINFDTALMGVLAGEMEFMKKLAQAGKLAQGLFIARKKD